MSLSDQMIVKPRILKTTYQRGVGLIVEAEYACGHLTRNTFPHAPRRASRQEIRGWLFGSPHALHYGMCLKCSKAAV